MTRKPIYGKFVAFFGCALICVFFACAIGGCPFGIAGGGSVGHDPEAVTINSDSVAVVFRCTVYDGYLYSSNRWTNFVLHYRWSATEEFVPVACVFKGRKGAVTEFVGRIPRLPQTDLSESSNNVEYYLTGELDGHPDKNPRHYHLEIDGNELKRFEHTETDERKDDKESDGKATAEIKGGRSR